VQEEFAAYLKCGRLEHGFLRVRYEACHAEKLVAFSCKRRGFGPSCGARRMTDSAALLADEVLPQKPLACLSLLAPFRSGDLNMASAWECSRNDVLEGGAVILTAGAVWVLDSGWPDIVVAVILLALFLRSARRAVGAAQRALYRPA
jgi:Transposase zinc-binding domain